jgi:hypothetical protein
MVKTEWNGRDVKIRNNRFKENTVFGYGIVLQSHAVSYCPYKDGRLRASITVKTKTKVNPSPKSGPTEPDDFIDTPIQEDEAYVGTNVIYGPAQEFGYKNMPPQPFMRPAADAAQGKALEIGIRNGRQEFKKYFDEWRK